MAKAKEKSAGVPALKVHQWLKEWGSNNVIYDKDNFRRQPDENFYIFSLPAIQLKNLSKIYRRDSSSGKPRSEDTNIQRKHEPTRSQNIREYIKYGYPWSDLSEAQRQDKFKDLRKPGWLPTAIVVNILKKEDLREGKSVSENDLIKIEESDNGAHIILPKGSEKTGWTPKDQKPIEVIDGQHRLWAFEDDKSIAEDYELPVVAFYGLDLSWQAYLFWTINIKPKRINPSMAFDLYPLLRTEEWLDRFEGHKVYREARAQELTENIWAYPKSIWYQRINMLGEKGGNAATQASWIRALLKTYVKSSEGRGVSLGGLFGAPVGQDKITIPWSRVQQAAFLIIIWNSLANAVKQSKAIWAKTLRTIEYKKAVEGDPAFFGPFSLLNNDQGLTVVLNVTNDIFFVVAEELELSKWLVEDIEANIESVCNDLMNQKKLIKFINDFMTELASFDWRSSAEPSLTDEERLIKSAFRGGTGYKVFREILIKHLCNSDGEIGVAAKKVSDLLGYSNAK